MKAKSIKPIISFNDFDKVDIRIGTIERVEDERNRFAVALQRKFYYQ
jgi:tRNA-binding EMAP/Myf-like protein